MFELILNWVYRQFPESSTDDAFALAQRMYSIVELHDSYWYTQPMWRIYDQLEHMEPQRRPAMAQAIHCPPFGEPDTVRVSAPTA